MNPKYEQLQSGLKFLEAIDALKNTYRKCLIMSGHREESTAEHSFSLAMAVLALCSLSNEPIDKMKAVKMALFHDLAEALLGDTLHYNKPTSPGANTSEAEALKRLLLPIQDSELSIDIFNLWHEFEHGDSPEAVFLRGLDRFLPMYHNYKTAGHTWIKYGITKQMALTKNAHIEQGSTTLWNYTLSMLDESHAKGWIL